LILLQDFPPNKGHQWGNSRCRFAWPQPIGHAIGGGVDGSGLAIDRKPSNSTKVSRLAPVAAFRQRPTRLRGPSRRYRRHRPSPPAVRVPRRATGPSRPHPPATRQRFQKSWSYSMALSLGREAREFSTTVSITLDQPCLETESSHQSLQQGHTY
jgi:hypothetical protein